MGFCEAEERGGEERESGRESGDMEEGKERAKGKRGQGEGRKKGEGEAERERATGERE